MSDIMNNMLSMTINNIKSIKHVTFELPLENNLYAIVGNNGTGKSTIIYSLAQLISKASLASFGIGYGVGDSYVEFRLNEVKNRWNVEQDKYNSEKVFLPIPLNRIRINGMYEGSLFFGFRFQNYDKVKKLLSLGKITNEFLTKADEYIVEQLGYILHGDKKYYEKFNIVRLKNKTIVEKLGLEETPYFMNVGNSLFSQYGMSSGECLMISLLHFIFNSIVRRSLDPKYPVLMLIDEIEVALHPIAVSRLVDLLNDLVSSRSNLTIYITTHSPHVITKIKPQNMFKIEIDDSSSEQSLLITNPCYPSYAIRDVYRHDGYDWLLLVEDRLAQIVVERCLSNEGFNSSKLIHVTPVGGWENVLKLQADLLKNNVLGNGKKILSILDGDINSECNKKKEYIDLPKFFLPIASIEKYLKTVLVDKKNNDIYKKIKDEFFQLKNLDSVIQEYRDKVELSNDLNGKKFYKGFIIKTINERGISEDQFVNDLSQIIIEKTDFSDFVLNLKDKLL